MFHVDVKSIEAGRFRDVRNLKGAHQADNHRCDNLILRKLVLDGIAQEVFGCVCQSTLTDCDAIARRLLPAARGREPDPITGRAVGRSPEGGAYNRSVISLGLPGMTYPANDQLLRPGVVEEPGMCGNSLLGNSGDCAITPSGAVSAVFQ